jgi:hypothetical protein
MLRANMLNIAWFGVWALAGLLLVPLVGLLALELWFGGCSDERRAVLEELPHYGDRPIEPYSGEASCNVGYPTDATREEILAYYDGQLRENSWEVMGFWAADHPPKGVEFYGEGLSSVSGALESVGGGLGAKRGNYRYRVTYEPPGTGDPGGETPAGEEVSTEDAQVVLEVTEEPGGSFPK